MLKKVLQNLLSLKLFQKAVLVACLPVLLFSILNLVHEINRILLIKRKFAPHQQMGVRFEGLEKDFKGTEIGGYYTDKDLDKDENARQFAQAQYLLAPTLLDINNTSVPLIIFDCSSDAVALKKIVEIGAVPVKKNGFGVILARKQ